MAQETNDIIHSISKHAKQRLSERFGVGSNTRMSWITNMVKRPDFHEIEKQEGGTRTLYGTDTMRFIVDNSKCLITVYPASYDRYDLNVLPDDLKQNIVSNARLAAIKAKKEACGSTSQLLMDIGRLQQEIIHSSDEAEIADKYQMLTEKQSQFAKLQAEFQAKNNSLEHLCQVFWKIVLILKKTTRY